ncbi:MAG: molybdenum cofactor guanylyltransferase [Bacteroidales bacterium]|jgi:molybdopterin-guanine dinucleotide biosynthesis protein A|nr:molybdenum cofactor guanylyltransferase [Bacteroidales bacterium]
MELFKEQNKMSAVILAGGANARFNGKTKANIQISGVRIIARTIKILHEIFEEIIIVTNTPEDFKGYQHFTIVPDEIKNVGPLGGIHAAMRVAKNDSVFVFASDMPCISSGLIKKHIEFYYKRECDAAIPRIREDKEPLHSIYHRRIFDRLDKFLKAPNKYSFDNFIKDLDIRYNNLDDIVEHRRAFININTPQDLSCMALYDEVHHY